MPQQNPCMRCGACCAAYRISFDCLETDAHPEGTVPDDLTRSVGAGRVVMRGTEKRPYRCQALDGEIGRSVCCSIYDRRPTTCRNFLTMGDDNVFNALCDQARARYGLTPLGGF